MKAKKREILLLLPSLAGFCFFYMAPFFRSLYYAFLDNAFSEKFALFGNFKSLFASEYFRLAIKNTFIFTIISVPLIMLASVTAAFLIAECALKIPFVRKAFFLPVLLPSATVVAMMQAFFLEVPPFPSLLLVYLWKYMGLIVMLTLTSFTSLNGEMLEAARIDGAGKLRTVISVCLPNMTPTLLFSLILSFVNSLKIYRESFLLYGNYPDESIYMLQNYLNNHFDKLNYQNISAAAILIFAAVYIIVVILLAIEKKAGEHL
ncbi:MAG: sugar ABC transporter permease [Clostridia bacterium]|nr:sugar ABC transporter permease [Clostridia bacterium]